MKAIFFFIGCLIGWAIMSQAHQAPEIVIYAVTLLFGLVPAALM